MADPGSIATPSPELHYVARSGPKTGVDRREEINKQRKHDAELLISWWLRRMVAVQTPLPEKLTFLWHNHFATSITKVKQPAAMQLQNETLRTWGRSNFRELAAAILVDPAMLVWLDGIKNTVGAPNENLSREFIELFTLGHGGGYSEQDVREGARALTGWKINADGSTYRDPVAHDDDDKTVLGITGPLDEKGYLEAILAAPTAAPHIVARLYGQLVSDDAPAPALLSGAAAAFATGWNIPALVSELCLSEEFGQAGGTSIISPVEWLIGAVRALHIPLEEPRMVLALAKTLQSLGQLPFAPPSVAGWPSGPAWLSTAAVEIRMQAALNLTGSADLTALQEASATNRVDTAGYLLGVGSWSQRSRDVLQNNATAPRLLMALALNTPECLTH